MKSLWLGLHLLTDTVATESSATVGGHRSLSWLPGAQLLGAVARRAYAECLTADSTGKLAYRRFHSGSVRYGAGLPVGGDGGPTVAMPLALHAPKQGEGLVENRSRSLETSTQQLEQKRAGFLDGGGAVHQVEQTGTMRTAVGATGRAREGFLYGLQAIAAGTRLLARVDVDHDEDAAWLRGVLERDAELFLGRSRSAEFGRVRVSVLESAPAGAWACESQPAEVGVVVLLALSDVALRDAKTGQPRLLPEPADVGLEAPFRFEPSRSFLRTRVYSPFNAHRGRPDLERQVISAGSVLAFTADGRGADLSRVRLAIERGIGEHRADGLGRLLAEPTLLARASRPRLEAAAKAKDASPDGPENDPLAKWLLVHAERRHALDRTWDAALETSKQLAKARVPAAQWGEVRAIAGRFRGVGAEGLLRAIREHLTPPETTKNGGPAGAGKQAPDRRSVRHGDGRWGRPVGKKKAGALLLEMIGEREKEPLLAEWLELVATHTVREMKARKGSR